MLIIFIIYRQADAPYFENADALLASANAREAFPEEPGIYIEWAFIATWVNVTYLGVDRCYNDTNDPRIPRNTFQLVLAADRGNRSFVEFR